MIPSCIIILSTILINRTRLAGVLVHLAIVSVVPLVWFGTRHLLMVMMLAIFLPPHAANTRSLLFIARYSADWDLKFKSMQLASN